MIDIQREQLKTFAELAKLWPSRYPGKTTHKATLCRYARVGIKGIRLEAIRMGGHFVSSVEAVQRFTERLAALDENPDATPAEVLKMPTPAGRRRAAEKAAKELEALGF